MKKLLEFMPVFICFALLVPAAANAQIVSIPDANFKAALIKAGVDKDKDGEIQETEALQVDSLKVAIKEIGSLEGIKAFKHLKYLDCGFNDLHSLNVSANTELTMLNCGYNKLVLLNVAPLTNLQKLVCYDNHLVAIDVSHNKMLKEFDCSSNNLIGIDLSANKNLSSFTCVKNWSLKKVYVGAEFMTNESMKDSWTEWVKKPLIKNKPVVTKADAEKNRIVYIPDENFLLALIVGKADKNYDGQIQKSEADSVTVINNEFKSIYSLEGNTIYSLEGIAEFRNLKELDCSSNKLTSLDVSNNLLLTKLDCSANSISKLDVSKNLDLKRLNFSNNLLTAIDVSKNLQLIEITGSYNHELGLLDVYNNKELITLSVSNCNLSFLDVSQLAVLQDLLIGNNQLTAIDVSKNSKLMMLNCQYNKLKTLDVSANAALAYFNCEHNDQLAQIYIAASANPNSNWEKDYGVQWVKK